MGRILLVFRLVLGDVRRHPAQAAMLVLSLTVATAMLSLGASMSGATESLYEQTRAATAGPDVVSLAPGKDRDTTSVLRSLEDVPGVVARSRPYRQFFTTLTAHGATASAVALGADATPGPIDRPLVTSGSWVRPGGVVVERGFAAALGVHAGDRVTVAGRSLPVVGIAVTAARPVYPWATMGGPGGGPGDRAGLVWMNEPDTRALASAGLPVTSLVYLKLRDPEATQAFMDSYHDTLYPAGDPDADSKPRVNSFRWQILAYQDSVMLQGSRPTLVIGSWLLGFLAIAGMSTLAAGRAARQTRRVGLLKAVGANPGLIATVLLTEYLVLALLADALGLTAARLVAPAIINPSGSLITTAAGPSGVVIAMTTAAAIALATLTALGPTVRALRTDTVAALADTTRRPRHRASLARVAALLPTPLLLGVRLIARRPGRAILHACGTATTAIAITALLMLYAQPMHGWDLGSVTLANLKDDQTRHVMLGVAVALIILAVVNTITITWTTATEARATMAIARTLGATPGQITAGLSTAQLLPTLPGAIAGIPVGIFLCLLFSIGEVTMPPTWWLLAVPLALLLATAALTALPARIAARRSIAETLSAETA
ncbi:ABC transporter permease [Streptosporangium sp. 'caverna']|uniref:ABC transporter permease n=1 Tax=Streptosporangium sp. 'caverna' TaxID=2202249 RepID=UPI000D7E19EA|nr:FtsX-like permease family protein [Streptosporangium sp. 'caverna']AWS47926.1 ABC transporter permease [Streptosporangium sp. 'caverna']